MPDRGARRGARRNETWQSGMLGTRGPAGPLFLLRSFTYKYSWKIRLVFTARGTAYWSFITKISSSHRTLLCQVAEISTSSERPPRIEPASLFCATPPKLDVPCFLYCVLLILYMVLIYLFFVIALPLLFSLSSSSIRCLHR